MVVDRVTYAGSQPWPFPSSLMLGFKAHAATAIPVDGVEITTRGGSPATSCAAEVEAGELVIPSTISISGALVAELVRLPLPARRE